MVFESIAVSNPEVRFGVHYDAMIAKVVAYGPDRPTAIRILDRALRTARVHGVTTNVYLLRAILGDLEFAAGRVHTALLEQRLDRWTSPPNDDRHLRLAAIAAAAFDATAAAASSLLMPRIPAAFRNVVSQQRVRSYLRAGCQYDVFYRQSHGQLRFDDVDHVKVQLPESVVIVTDRSVSTRYEITSAHRSIDVSGPDGSYSFEPVPVFADPTEVVAEGTLLAPMPGTVVAVRVKDGEAINRGDSLLVLEAMKMQHQLTAPTSGIVSDLSVTIGQQVEAGSVLAVIEPDPTNSKE